MTRLVLFSQDLKLQPLLGSALGREYEVVSESNPNRLYQLLHLKPADVLLLDLDIEALPSETYLSLFDEASSTGAVTVLMVDDSGRSVAIELIDRGAHSYCRKPPALRELKAVLRRASEHAAMKRSLSGTASLSSMVLDLGPAASPTCDCLIGSSEPMTQVYDLIHRVANLNASVLITGDSGTGKELIARAVHNLGERKNHPFVAVSCGAIPETLIESELFGHEKGAFTGTAGIRVGYFEQAAGGTLFLDEIGELSSQTQVKLLRVLQQREFFRLGSNRPIPLRARMIFATHRNLPKLIEEGRFRLDLYYRLNVMTIHSPSLAERSEDIGLLARHFLSQYAELYGKSLTGISRTALAALEDYDWPGNVRELENAMQRAIICANSGEIQLSDLPAQMQTHQNGEAFGEVGQGGTFEKLLREYKVKLAMQAIEDCKGNKTLAAKNLDISRAYLHRLIRQTEVVPISAA